MDINTMSLEDIINCSLDNDSLELRILLIIDGHDKVVEEVLRRE